MQELVERIENEGVYLGEGIVKLATFLNHQIDPPLTHRMAQSLVAQLANNPAELPDRVLTVEASGIALAFEVAKLLGVPLTFARKRKSRIITSQCYQAETVSRTKGDTVTLMVEKPFLKAGERVLIIDDFLASGRSISALVEIASMAGSTVAGVGCAIEKPQESGRGRIGAIDAPVASLARVLFEGSSMSVLPGLCAVPLAAGRSDP